VNCHTLPHSAQGTLQADFGAGAGFGLAEVVVTPRRNKAAWARELKQIRTVEIGSDEEGGLSVLPAAGRARRSAKKGTTKVKAPTVATAGHVAKQPVSPARIQPASQPPSEGFAPTKEIDSDDPDNGGAQARTDWADEESTEGDGPPLPLSFCWGMEELQQRVYQERTAASVFAVAVSNARLRGKGCIDEAEAAIKDILTPRKGGPTALESALDLDASKTRAYIAFLAENDRGFTLMYNLQRADREIRPGNPIKSRVVAFGGKVRPDNDTPDVSVLEEDKEDLFERVYLLQVLVTDTLKAYKQDSGGDYTHTFVLDPATWHKKAKPTTTMMPIPLEWATMIVDNADFGTAVRRMRDLFMSVTDDERYCLVDIFEMMTRACCATREGDGAGSTLAVDWCKLKYHAKTRAWAEEKWALLKSNVGEDEEVMEQSDLEDYGEIFRGETARPSVVIPAARPNIGLQGKRTPCVAPDPTAAIQMLASRASGAGPGPLADKLGQLPEDMGSIADLLVRVMRAQAESTLTMHQSFQTTLLENI
jgi:hypothetical protein